MHTIFKAALTAVLFVALAWPFVFWGKPAHQGNSDNVAQPPLSYNLMTHPDHLW